MLNFKLVIYGIIRKINTNSDSVRVRFRKIGQSGEMDRHRERQREEERNWEKQTDIEDVWEWKKVYRVCVICVSVRWMRKNTKLFKNSTRLVDCSLFCTIGRKFEIERERESEKSKCTNILGHWNLFSSIFRLFFSYVFLKLIKSAIFHKRIIWLLYAFIPVAFLSLFPPILLLSFSLILFPRNYFMRWEWWFVVLFDFFHVSFITLPYSRFTIRLERKDGNTYQNNIANCSGVHFKNVMC